MCRKGRQVRRHRVSERLRGGECLLLNIDVHCCCRGSEDAWVRRKNAAYWSERKIVEIKSDAQIWLEQHGSRSPALRVEEAGVIGLGLVRLLFYDCVLHGPPLTKTCIVSDSGISNWQFLVAGAHAPAWGTPSSSGLPIPWPRAALPENAGGTATQDLAARFSRPSRNCMKLDYARDGADRLPSLSEDWELTKLEVSSTFYLLFFICLRLLRWIAR